MHTGRSLRVLLVEDSERDSELILRELRCGGYQPAALRVDTAAAMREALRSEWDLELPRKPLADVSSGPRSAVPPAALG